MDTLCTTILLHGCGHKYTLYVNTAGCGKRYTLHVHSAAWLWKWIHSARPCLQQEKIQPACQLCWMVVDMDTICMSILLSAVGGKGYTLHVHSAAWLWTLIHSACQYCWWWIGIHLARPYCWLQKWIHPARPYRWWWKGIHPARPHCLLWKGRSKRKHKRFNIEAYYRNKTKTFWFGPLIIGTKAERFNLFQNYFKSERNVLAFFEV